MGWRDSRSVLWPVAVWLLFVAGLALAVRHLGANGGGRGDGLPSDGLAVLFSLALAGGTSVVALLYFRLRRLRLGGMVWPPPLFEAIALPFIAGGFSLIAVAGLVVATRGLVLPAAATTIAVGAAPMARLRIWWLWAACGLYGFALLPPDHASYPLSALALACLPLLGVLVIVDRWGPPFVPAKAPAPTI